MKKSNKLTVFYVISSVSLFLVLLFGGIYGVYVSVGLNFVRSSVPEPIGETGVSNVSFGGNVSYTPSMTGIIFLSIILVAISIFDFVMLIKQVIFFKQFKAVKNSKITKKVEQKTSSKSGVIFWTFVIDILSLGAGVAGLFINSRSLAGGVEMGWVFYAVDILVSVLSLLSIILLIAKLKTKSNVKSLQKSERKNLTAENHQTHDKNKQKIVTQKDINQMEYNLMKLESMKKGKIVTDDEYKKLRRNILNFKVDDKMFSGNKD